jgi:HEAT repeat protein
MRIRLAVFVLLFAAGSAAAQQITASLDELLTTLHSKDWTVRNHTLQQLNSQPGFMSDRKVRAQLLDLLDRENHELDLQLKEAQREGYPDKGDNQGWADYYGDLLETVESFADWNDPRQACILVDAGSSDDSAFASETASHARTTVPCLVKRSQSAISMNRAVAVPVLVQVLAIRQDALGPKTVKTVKQIVLSGLNDPDAGVRADTVIALGNYGGTDMIPALQEIVQSDPASEKTDNGGQWFPIRKSATKAIAEIQERTSQK